VRTSLRLILTNSCPLAVRDAARSGSRGRAKRSIDLMTRSRHSNGIRALSREGGYLEGEAGS